MDLSITFRKQNWRGGRVAKYTIQYRQLKTENLGTEASLKQMIIDAMRAERVGSQIGLSAKARIIDLDQDESFVILNKITDQLPGTVKYSQGS